MYCDVHTGLSSDCICLIDNILRNKIKVHNICLFILAALYVATNVSIRLDSKRSAKTAVASFEPSHRVLESFDLKLQTNLCATTNITTSFIPVGDLISLRSLWLVLKTKFEFISRMQVKVTKNWRGVIINEFAEVNVTVRRIMKLK